MPTGRPHPAETRARVVGEILAGEPIHKVAKRWNIPYPTAQGWWSEDRPADSINVRTRERMLEQVYDTAFECLDGVRASARLLQDSTWTSAQSAEGLAALVAVLGERAVRMLGGLRPSEPVESSAIDGSVVDPALGPPTDGAGV